MTMVVCRLEMADHRQKAPPWTTTVRRIKPDEYDDYIRKIAEEREEAVEYAEAIARTLERQNWKLAAAAYRRKKGLELQSRPRNDETTQHESEGDKPTTTERRKMDHETTMQWMRDETARMRRIEEQIKQQQHDSDSDKPTTTDNTHESESESEKPTTKPPTITAVKAAANSPTIRWIVCNRRFPDPKYLNSTQQGGELAIRCFDFKAKSTTARASTTCPAKTTAMACSSEQNHQFR